MEPPVTLREVLLSSEVKALRRQAELDRELLAQVSITLMLVLEHVMPPCDDLDKARFALYDMLEHAQVRWPA